MLFLRYLRHFQYFYDISGTTTVFSVFLFSSWSWHYCKRKGTTFIIGYLHWSMSVSGNSVSGNSGNSSSEPNSSSSRSADRKTVVESLVESLTESRKNTSVSSDYQDVFPRSRVSSQPPSVILDADSSSKSLDFHKKIYHICDSRKNTQRRVVLWIPCIP